MAKTPQTTKPGGSAVTENVPVKEGVAVEVTRATPPSVVDLAVDYEKQSDWTKATARAGYEAYIANSGGLAWDGRPCPKWADLNNAVRSHWCAAVLGVAPFVRSKADVELNEQAERVLAMDEALRAANAEISSLMLRLEASGASPADEDRVTKLAYELKTCREQLSIANASIKERDQKLKALSSTGDQKAVKYAAERTAMLDGEVDKLREQVSKLEAALRERG